MLFSWTGTGAIGSGSQIMHTNCAGVWQTNCFGPDGLEQWTFACGGTAGNVRVEYHHFATVCGGTSAPHDDVIGFTIGTIYPFTHTTDLVTGTPPTFMFNARADGYQTITFSDPSPGSYCCYMYFSVDYGGNPATGAVVTIWTNSSKTTQLATGTVDINGIVDLNIGNHAGSIYYEVSGHGVNTVSATVSVTCGQYNSVTPRTVSLTTKTGYVAVGACPLPVATTLHATHPIFGAITFTYNGSGSLGAGWYATVSYAYSACLCCPAKTVTITCFIDTGFNFSDHWKSN